MWWHDTTKLTLESDLQNRKSPGIVFSLLFERFEKGWVLPATIPLLFAIRHYLLYHLYRSNLISIRHFKIISFQCQWQTALQSEMPCQISTAGSQCGKLALHYVSVPHQIIHQPGSVPHDMHAGHLREFGDGVQASANINCNFKLVIYSIIIYTIKKWLMIIRLRNF